MTEEGPQHAADTAGGADDSRVTDSELTVEGLPRKFQTRNFVLLVMHGAIFNIGWAMPGVVRDPFLNWLRVKNSTIGLIGSFSCLSIVGLLFAPLISRYFRRKKVFSFFMSMPYYLSASCVGTAILLAMYTDTYSWLKGVVIFFFMCWPFAAGWGGVPSQEYIANCISKERVGAFIGTSSAIGPFLGLLGSAIMTAMLKFMGVPFRYAAAFMLAYLFAQSGAITILFAHETPAPSPPREAFWRPGLEAVTKDRVFRRMLLAMIVMIALLSLPRTFIPYLAIREWGFGDWVAGVYITVSLAGISAGAFLATWLGQRVGYGRVVKIAIIVLIISFIPLIIPEMGEGKADIYHGSWTLTAEQSQGQEVNRATAEPVTPATDAEVLGPKIVSQHPAGAVEGAVEYVEIQFNKPIDSSTFNVYDVQVTSPEGKILEMADVIPSGDSAKTWHLVFKEPLTAPGIYKLVIRPNIADTNGNAMDQNGNGKVGQGQWRFFVQAAIFGISNLSGIVFMSLMYILAPDNRRAGYFAAYGIVSTFVPSFFIFISGLLFMPGNYQKVFTGMFVLTIVMSGFIPKLLRPVIAMERKQRAMDREKE